jgi:hypothetical protein
MLGCRGMKQHIRTIQQPLYVEPLMQKKPAGRKWADAQKSRPGVVSL